MLRTADKRLFVGKQVCCDVFDPTYHSLADVRAGLSVSSWDSSLANIGANVASPASTAWPATNRAVFVPIPIIFPVVAERIVVACGTAAGGNFDVGIYKPDGTRLVSSGTTARVASSEVVLDITDTYLRRGLYFLAMSLDGTGTMVGKTPAQLAFTKLMGVRTMETAFVLPATATFVTAASAFVPLFQVLFRPGFTKPSIQTPDFTPLVITPWHTESLGSGLGMQNLFLSATASRIPGANLVSYVPFRVNAHATVRKMSLLVGAANTGNVDVGLYTAAGARIVNSGSTALGTINTLQEFDITDTLLAPGTYFMAATLSNAAGTWFGISQNDEILMGGVPIFQETTGGFGLPATATMILSTSATPLWPPVMGVHFDTLV